ncbi:hypothetical protein PG991_013811, partial [Apiospora marii]
MRQWETMVNGKEKYTGNTITLTHRQGPQIGRGKLVLNRHWLRDGCQCSSCVDPHSGQKNFGTTDVPLDLPISSCRKTENGALEIVWQNDFLSNGRESPPTAKRGGGKGGSQGKKKRRENGFACTERTWEGRKPEAENVAYTSSFLGLHQDMLYLKDPPRLQLLHCLENSCDGGESLFSDASRAAHLMKIGPPELRDALSSRRVAYHYKKHGHHYENNHSVIDSSGHVRWSPPFQAPLRNLQKSEQGVEDYRTWAAAAVRFQQLLEQEEFLFEYKMQPGDCVIFDNLRVVHGRRAFDTSAGSRWLKGTYNAHDVFMSKLRTVCGQGTPKPSLGRSSVTAQALRMNQMHNVWEKPSMAEKPKIR